MGESSASKRVKIILCINYRQNDDGEIGFPNLEILISQECWSHYVSTEQINSM